MNNLNPKNQINPKNYHSNNAYSNYAKTVINLENAPWTACTLITNTWLKFSSLFNIMIVWYFTYYTLFYFDGASWLPKSIAGYVPFLIWFGVQFLISWFLRKDILHTHKASDLTPNQKKLRFCAIIIIQLVIIFFTASLISSFFQYYFTLNETLYTGDFFGTVRRSLTFYERTVLSAKIVKDLCNPDTVPLVVQTQLNDWIQTNRESLLAIYNQGSVVGNEVLTDTYQMKLEELLQAYASLPQPPQPPSPGTIELLLKKLESLIKYWVTHKKRRY